MKLKALIIIAIFLMLIIGGAFYISLQKDTEVLVVQVTLAKPPQGDQIIQDIKASLEYTTRLNAPKETPLEAPGITVIAKQNNMEISGWHSTSLPADKSIYGSYNITVGLITKIDKNQPISINARVLSPTGEELSVAAKTITLT